MDTKRGGDSTGRRLQRHGRGDGHLLNVQRRLSCVGTVAGPGIAMGLQRSKAMEPVTIMLVEDEALLLFEFEEALPEAGFNVVACSSGTKAVEYLRSAEGAAEGVVTDIRLPDRAFDGWEVARIAREIDPEVAVVYISGHGAVDWPSRGVPNSIVLEKPFAIAQLITAISQLLNGPLADASS